MLLREQQVRRAAKDGKVTGNASMITFGAEKWVCSMQYEHPWPHVCLRSWGLLLCQESFMQWNWELGALAENLRLNS